MNIIRNGVSYPLAEVEMETIFRAQREKYWVEDFNLYIEAYKETEELTQEQWKQVQDIAINHFEKDTCSSVAADETWTDSIECAIRTVKKEVK